VRGHAVSFSAAAWDDPPGLPASVPRTGRIARGDVLDIGELVRDGKLGTTDLFAASFVWGWGSTGFGPRRYRDIVAAAGGRLEPSLQRALAVINKDPGSPDPIAGYAQLYGGYDYETRAAPGQAPWSRLRGFGPAFFTKFLYFSTLGALILDNRLANAVYSRSGIPHLVTAKGQSLAWTPYRYAVYLHWMRQAASTLDISPELLELTLFCPPNELSDEDNAAD
jgi:Putative 8-oxoguanine DNA glycosylase OGG-like protein